MNMSDMKNIVVLKNLPSNLVEEAFVVLKDSKRVHKYQVMNTKQKEKENKNRGDDEARRKNKVEKDKIEEKDNGYIIKEAEMLVKEYTENLEKKSPKWKNNMKKLEKRYKTSVKLNFLLLFTTLVGFIFSVIL